MTITIPDDPKVLTNLAGGLRWTGEWTLAQDLHWQALKQDPGWAPAWQGLGMISEDLGQMDEALRYYGNAWALRGIVSVPQRKQIALALAQARLRLGDWGEETWGLWDLGRQWDPVPRVPRWDGVPVANLLITPEGGLGDVIWLLRQVEKLPARSVGLMCPEEMVDLLVGMVPPVRIRVLGEEVNPEDWDVQIPLMSVLSRLKSPKDVHRVPARENNYSAGLRVGLCWEAGEQGVQRPHRAVPQEALEPLKTLPVEWVNLTLSKGPEWAGTPLSADWMETFKVMETLDWVVSTDTSVLHLAGLIGIPTLGMIPLRGDWKYLQPNLNPKTPLGEGSVWYESLHLIRQDDPVSWSSVITRVVEILG